MRTTTTTCLVAPQQSPNRAKYRKTQKRNLVLTIGIIRVARISTTTKKNQPYDREMEYHNSHMHRRTRHKQMFNRLFLVAHSGRRPRNIYICILSRNQVRSIYLSKAKSARSKVCRAPASFKS